MGNINWLPPSRGIPTYALQNLFHTLEGDSSLKCLRQLIPAAECELELIDEIVNKSYIDRIDSLENLNLIMLQI